MTYCLGGNWVAWGDFGVGWWNVGNLDLGNSIINVFGLFWTVVDILDTLGTFEHSVLLGTSGYFLSVLNNLKIFWHLDSIGYFWIILDTFGTWMVLDTLDTSGPFRPVMDILDTGHFRHFGHFWTLLLGTYGQFLDGLGRFWTFGNFLTLGQYY